MIILQGVIREDGSVGELKVLQGFHETVDQAALAAFSRWKFRPAQRSTKPIAVEILVGIPVILPVT
jgi:TonB family protein